MQTNGCCNSDVVLTFKEGLFGFESIKKYKLVRIDDEIPFFFMRAAEGGATQFIVCDPVFFVPEYRLKYEQDVLTELDAESAEDLRCLVIATVPDSLENTTVNLKSPVIFNINNMLAKQFVLYDLDYPIRYKLLSAAGR